MIIENDIRVMARTMHHGGCDNSAIASAVARCSRAMAHAELLNLPTRLPAALANARVDEIVQDTMRMFRQEGWFE